MNITGCINNCCGESDQSESEIPCFVSEEVLWNVAEYILEDRQVGNSYASIDRVYRPSHDFHARGLMSTARQNQT